jgi:hypothetical protein
MSLESLGELTRDIQSTESPREELVIKCQSKP